MSITDRLRRPEYTGKNRCTPCTAVNVVIAVGVSALATVASTILGAGLFVFSLGTIYFRGYLVPGTPTLTKRYLPERILGWFGKGSTAPLTDKTVEIDSERVFLDAGAVEPCREGTDLCLTPAFREAWRERIHTVRTHDPDEVSLINALSIPPEDSRITVDQQGDAFVAYTDDAVVGQWGSQAAVIADVAAAAELNERFPGWKEFSPVETAHVLMSLRIFLTECPKCDGPVQIEQSVVESCCQSYDVVASACQNCNARLFEMELDDTNINKTHAQSGQSAQTSA